MRSQSCACESARYRAPRPSKRRFGLRSTSRLKFRSELALAENTNEDKADATLNGEITQITRVPARSVRENVLATTEFSLALTVKFTLTARDGKPIPGGGDVTGSTTFFVSSDPTTDERQALPLATENLATRLVAQLSEGW